MFLAQSIQRGMPHMYISFRHSRSVYKSVRPILVRGRGRERERNIGQPSRRLDLNTLSCIVYHLYISLPQTLSYTSRVSQKISVCSFPLSIYLQSYFGTRQTMLSFFLLLYIFLSLVFPPSRIQSDFPAGPGLEYLHRRYDGEFTPSHLIRSIFFPPHRS